ncbi:hypothetical protein PENSTE_c003G04978 [Penicillium steckii]|uniref:Uncharacterized protein n=1 Tax=Penicillium steckii TaxID=303698 RepID=A0A1V6TSD4_9EURO|nr:hypothetical protein PENSTE_c003G04978 [Penicillium steckii]
MNMFNDDQPVEIRTDSRSAEITANGTGYAKPTKWIDRRYHFVRDVVKQEKVIFTRIPTADNVADGLTKALNHICLVYETAKPWMTSTRFGSTYIQRVETANDQGHACRKFSLHRTTIPFRFSLASDLKSSLMPKI